jgi:hypothetical protein
VKLTGGVPTISFRDLAIQRRENDLVCASFGRGIYVLDDYSALREVSEEALAKPAALFPTRQAWWYVPQEPLGEPARASQGAGYFMAENPPFGAVFTYHLAEEIRSRDKDRQEAEKPLVEAGKDTPFPGWEAVEAERREPKPAVVLTVRDEAGNVVRRVPGKAAKGFQRVAWDLRYPPASPTKLKADELLFPWSDPPLGPLAAPGSYTVALAKRVDGKLTPVGEPQRFAAQPLALKGVETGDRAGLLAFQQRVARLQRAVMGAVEAAKETQQRIDHLKKAVDDTPGAEPALAEELRAVESRLKDVQGRLEGDPVKGRRNEPTLPGIDDRVERIVEGSWVATAAPTGTQREGYDVAAKLFGKTLAELRKLIETDLHGIEQRAEAAGAPWTPGRVPRWEP